MAANDPPNPAQQLQNLHHIVHLVYHRNKNQHRRSLWWRHLNSFRRNLRTLSSAATGAADNPAAPARPAIIDGGPTAPLQLPPPRPLSLPPSLQPLLRRWAADRVPRWHAAFSRVLAERRFVAVGLVLLAALAQAVELLGVRALMEEAVRRERRMAADERDAPTVADQGDEDLDLGVVVDRGAIEAGDAVEEESGEKRTERRKRSTKRRKGNVIDDLFDELG